MQNEELEDEEEFPEWMIREALHFAASNGDLRKVKELLAQGYDINAFDEDLSWTPLHNAAKEEHFEIVEFLLESGADVNAHDPERIGETPLGNIADNCTYRMAKLLIDAGADPTIPGWMQITALDRAKQRKKNEGIRVYELLRSASQIRHNQSLLDNA